MKTRTTFILFLTAIITLAGGSAFGVYSGGTGEPNDPYQIADANDLLDLAATIADYSKYFILTADIDMEGQVFATAIIAADTSSSSGFQGTAFIGTFDGNSHKITNFTIDGGSNDYLGLFGYIFTGASVKNLGLENCAVSGDSDSYKVGGLVGGSKYGSISDCYSTGTVSGFDSVGGLVGYTLYGSISNCYSTGAVSGSGSSNCVGGLVGSNSGIINNCYSTGAVICGSGYYYGRVGGLVGCNSSIISNCYSTGAVSVSGSSGSQDVGGLVGSNVGNISDCYSTGAVICGSGDYYGNSSVGGLVGYNGGGDISDCYSTGSVTGRGDSWGVGGLVGYNKGGSSSIINCYSTGAVSGSDSVGGLVGYKEWGSISNCYSTGTVSGSSWGVGGLVGSNIGSISDCYSTGAVSGSFDVGGLVGYNQIEGSSISHCYFLITSGPDNGYGTPLSDEQMKQQSSFIGWDFTNETANGTNDYWRMCVDGVDYPRLNWESIPGDFVCPDGVNMEDLDYLVERWLLGDCASSNNCGGADIDGSGVVDFADFAIFAQHWLEGS